MRRHNLRHPAWMQLKFHTAFVSVLMASASGAAASPSVLEPTSKWVVNYADDMCLLERWFGTGRHSVELAFEADSMGQGADLHIMRTGAPYAREKANVRVLADGADVAIIHSSTYSVPSKGVILTNLFLDRDQLSKLGAATEIAFSPDRDEATRLTVPAFAAALRALETCRADLVLGWGMSLADQARIKSEAKSSFKGAGGFSSDDYPNSALRGNEQGKARVRLRVDANGKVTECFVMHSSGSADLDKETCDVYRTRYHYSPAVDTYGKPMASFVVSSVVWAIPGN